MAAVPQIKLYLDVVSPFAYIAFYALQHDTVFKNCKITYVPIFLGGLMKTCGNTAPLYIKNKDKWISRERQLWAQTLNVPMKTETPAGFPPLTLSAMRCLAVLANGEDGQQRLIRALEAIYDGFWTRHEKTYKPEILQPLLENLFGKSVTDHVMTAAGNEGKSILAHNTDEAFASGAFGLPWMVCTNAKGKTESFWGVDHLGQLAVFMDLSKPSTAPWKALL